MKRKMAMILLCCLAVAFSGCGKQKAAEEPQQAEEAQLQAVPQ